MKKRRPFSLKVPKDVVLKGSLEPTVDQIRLGMAPGSADDRTTYAVPHESFTGGAEKPNDDRH